MNLQQLLFRFLSVIRGQSELRWIPILLTTPLNYTGLSFGAATPAAAKPAAGFSFGAAASPAAVAPAKTTAAAPSFGGFGAAAT